MKPKLYNYPGGAGGESLSARLHGMDKMIDKMGKVHLVNQKHNLPKDKILEGTEAYYQSLLIDRSLEFYLTHHLYVLDDQRLSQIGQIYDIVNIDDSKHHNQTFLMKLFKDYLRLRSGEVTLFIDGNPYKKKISKGSVASELHDLLSCDLPQTLEERILHLVDEYGHRKGPFYKEHLRWHSMEYPGTYIEYLPKERLGHCYIQGSYWDLDALLDRMINAQA